MDDRESSDLARGLEVILGLVGDFPGGSVAAALLNQVPRLQRINTQALLSSLIEMLGDGEQGLVARIKDDPRVARLVWDASAAAAHADTRAKVLTLARIASRGVQDDALLDEARYLIAVIRQLDVIDVRLLVAVDEARLGRDEGLDTQVALGVSAGTAESLNAKLLQLAVVESPGMSYRALHSKVRMSALGAEILAYLRAAGGGDPLAPLP